METITISYASFLLLFAYRWPLLLHWRLQRCARAHVNIFGPEKGSWTFITSLYVPTMNSTIQFLHSLSLFSNWDQIPNSYHVPPYSILEEVLVLIYGLKSSHILPTSSETNSNFCIIFISSILFQSFSVSSFILFVNILRCNLFTFQFFK